MYFSFINRARLPGLWFAACGFSFIAWKNNGRAGLQHTICTGRSPGLLFCICFFLECFQQQKNRAKYFLFNLICKDNTFSRAIFLGITEYTSQPFYLAESITLLP